MKNSHNERVIMKSLGNWVNSYGMINEDELWATAIELYDKLPPVHKKRIINIMLTHG